MNHAFRNTALVAALAALGLACGAAFAQTGATASNQPGSTTYNQSAPQNSATTTSGGSYSSSPRANGSSLAHADAKFVEKAAQGGLAEVQLGQLAQQKAQSDDVKNFAKRMVDDHTKANDELKKVAEGKNIMLPTALDRKDQKLLDKLGKLDGARFDHEYMEHMVSDHKKDVKEFEHEAKHGKDADVKGFAENTLPTLRDHLQLAQAAEKTAKAEKKGAKKIASAR
jgi:putative membrane protein